MEIILTAHLDRRCADKAIIVNELSVDIEGCLCGEQYNDSIEELYISILALSEEFKASHKQMKPKYTKSKRIFEYEIDFDFEQFNTGDDNALRKIILEGILVSLHVISEKVNGFNVSGLEMDLRKLLR